MAEEVTPPNSVFEKFEKKTPIFLPRFPFKVCAEMNRALDGR